MSNFIEHKDSVAFHPGYYLEEIIQDGSLTKQELANRIDMTEADLSKLISAEQSLSADTAMRLSNALGTSPEYWLNLQHAYDEVFAKAKPEQLH